VASEGWREEREIGERQRAGIRERESN
jgi:hypothetical protein